MTANQLKDAPDYIRKMAKKVQKNVHDAGAQDEIPPEFNVQARVKRIEELLNTRFNAAGFKFMIGEEIDVPWDIVFTALNKLYVLRYAQQYNLMPRGVPSDVLTAMTKDLALQYIPFIISQALRYVDSNRIDVADPDNMSLIGIIDILSWYWFKNGGPRPETKEAVRQSKIAIKGWYYQNEPLRCPLCNKQFHPPVSYKTQQSKFWAWVRWLPKHGVEYHLYTLPKGMAGTKTKEKES